MFTFGFFHITFSDYSPPWWTIDNKPQSKTTDKGDYSRDRNRKIEISFNFEL